MFSLMFSFLETVLDLQQLIGPIVLYLTHRPSPTIRIVSKSLILTLKIVSYKYKFKFNFRLSIIDPHLTTGLFLIY